MHTRPTYLLALLLFGIALSGCSKKPEAIAGSVPVVTSTAATQSAFPLQAVSPAAGSNAKAIQQLVVRSEDSAAAVRSAVRALLAKERANPVTAEVMAEPNVLLGARTTSRGPDILDPGLVDPMPLPRALQERSEN